MTFFNKKINAAHFFMSGILAFMADVSLIFAEEEFKKDR